MGTLKAVPRIVSSLGLALLLTAGPAAGAPADSAPKVEGPLLQQGEPSCEEQDVILRGIPVAAIQSCLWWFAYVPVLETTVDRDFGSLWFQATVRPRAGWCLDRVAGSLYSSPDVTEMHSYAVGGTGTDPRLPSVSLDADGSALQPAMVSQEMGRLRGAVKARPHLDAGAVDFSWKGRSARPIHSVVGAEISWDSASSAIEVFEFGRLLNPSLTQCARRN